MNNNLLIIGAGGHGISVKETAEALEKFERIDFLDDRSSVAIGRWDQYEQFKTEYSYAFVAIGNNRLRSTWFEKLKNANYNIPKLVHPTAYVSSSAQLGAGTIVLPMAVIHNNVEVERGCIIGIGALLDHDVKIDEFCQIDAGAILKGEKLITRFTKVQAGALIDNTKTT